MPPDPARAREAMVEHQLRRRGITDGRVLAAMARVPREVFVPPSLQRQAYDDNALPIGYGQTISQPFVVAAMCELLALRGHEHVLDVGTGSGYAAAVLAELAADVVSVERIPVLGEEARAALERAGYRNVEVRLGDGSLGAPDRAPFDAIAVAAAAPSIPEPLVEQLTDGGRLVVPRGSRSSQRLVRVVKTPDGLAESASMPVRFVPLVGARGFASDRLR